MTKQEYIREGFIELLDRIFISAGVHNHREQAQRITDEKFLSYLHSQGVVIKVGDQKTPEVPVRWEDKAYAYLVAQADMLRAGYVAAEPLIEEKVPAPIEG